MPARKIKTLQRNPNERKHREHRSKRGRMKLDVNHYPRKKYLESLKEQEMDRETEKYI